MTGGGQKWDQICRMILVVAWAVGTSVACSPIQSQPVDPLSADTSNCDAPASTPACAALAFSHCLWLNKPSLCAMVGAGDLVLWDRALYTEADLAAVPREYVGRLGLRFPVFYEMMPGANVVGRLDANGLPILGSDKYSGNSKRLLAVRQVDRGRFRHFGNSGKNVPERFMGSHEVLLGLDFVQSIFFRLEGSRWIITSFASDGMDCIVNGEADNYFTYLWRCHRSLPIAAWSSYYPGLWTKLSRAARD
ncbi:MAG: hypothetical protein HQ502_20355 [Alphaproteobacteria bacterium]|nr:hypothetical protein [Alphaproteobacteria bacterium]